MAIIPRSKGRMTAQPQMQQQTPLTGLGKIGQSIGGVMNQRDEKLREQEANQKKIALYHDQMAEQEAKVKVDDVLTTEMSEQVTRVKNDLSNGVVNADTARTNLQTWSNERYKQMESDLPLHARQQFKDYWNDNVNRQTTGFLPLQLRADAQKSVALVDRAFDIATRLDEQQGGEYLENYLGTANISESDKYGIRQKYQTTRNTMAVDARIANAVSGQNIGELQSLITDLDSGKYAHLDGPTVQQKKAQALSRIGALEQKEQIEENKRKTMANKVFTDFKSQVLTGRALDDAYLGNVKSAVAGTEHEGEFNFYQQQSASFQNFSRLSTSEQLKLINTQKANMKNSKSSDPVSEEKILGVYEEIYRDKLQLVKENPNQAVRDAGVQVHELKSVEMRTSPRSFATKIVENGVNQLSMGDANSVLRPISVEELPELKKSFDGMGVNEKLNFISQMISQGKGLKQGSLVWAAALGQLGAGDLSYVMAGVAKMNGFRSEQGIDVATSILSGTQALKNKALVFPTDDLLRQKFNEYVGNTATGATANMTFSAYKALYADITQQKNYQHADNKSLDSEASELALKLATGGVYEQAKFGNTKWKVSKPYGMKDKEFEDKLNPGYSYISQQTGIDVDDLKDLRLRRSDKKSAKGEIQYDLLNDRGNPLNVKGVVWRINMIGATK